MPKINIIAAIGQNRELGKDNKLLWHIPEDLKRFKKLTTGHVVIMGRKTFESIGRPLPNRTNIVITHDRNYTYTAKGCVVTHSIEEALEIAYRKYRKARPCDKQGQPLKKEIFIIGGGQIYKQTLPLADRLYLTIVEGNFDADTFFPNYSRFNKVITEENRSSGNYNYTFLTLASQGPALRGSNS